MQKVIDAAKPFCDNWRQHHQIRRFIKNVMVRRIIHKGYIYEIRENTIDPCKTLIVKRSISDELAPIRIAIALCITANQPSLFQRILTNKRKRYNMEPVQ